MNSEIPARSVYELMDTKLHDEIKWRAYELYERQHGDLEREDIRNELQFELPRVVYAAAHIQMANYGVGDDRVVRAARVYLRALTSFIAQS